MTLKRVRKRDLCSLIRFLNFYYLNQKRIHYFSIRVKSELIADLRELYSIVEDDDGVNFTATHHPLPDFRYGPTGWLMNGRKVRLPRSRKECVRRLQITRGPVTIRF